MNLLGLWGSRGHHSWMWCDLQTCSWLKPKLWGCNVHVCMSTTWGLRRVLNYHNLPQKKLWKLPKWVDFKISKSFPFPQKKAQKFQEDPYARIFRPQGRGMRNLEMEGGSGQEIASGLGLAPAVLLGKDPGTSTGRSPAWTVMNLPEAPLWMTEDCFHRSWGF